MGLCILGITPPLFHPSRSLISQCLILLHLSISLFLPHHHYCIAFIFPAGQTRRPFLSCAYIYTVVCGVYYQNPIHEFHTFFYYYTRLLESAIKMHFNLSTGALALLAFASNISASIHRPSRSRGCTAEQDSAIEWDTAGLSGPVNLHLCPGGATNISQSIKQIAGMTGTLLIVPRPLTMI